MDIVNSANNKNNDYCVSDFYGSLQIDVCNSNNTDHETTGDSYDSQEDAWLQKQYKSRVFLSFFLHTEVNFLSNIRINTEYFFIQ